MVANLVKDFTTPVYLHGVVNKKSCGILLDTGSDATLIPASVVRDLSLNQTTQVLTAANGSDIPLIGEITVAMKIGTQDFMITGLVCEHVQEVLLGMDWFKSCGIVWDFDEAKINIRGVEHQLHGRTEEVSHCRRVILQQDVTVPPRVEMDVPTKVVFRKLPVESIARYWMGD